MGAAGALLLVAGLLAAPAAFGAAVASQAALRGQVEVDSSVIRVGDVFSVGSFGAAGHHVAALPLWAAPAPCRPARITKAEIAARLHELRVSLDIAPGMEGAIVVSRVCQRIEAAQLQGVAQQALAGWLATRAARYEVEPVGPQAPIELPGRGATLVARPLEAGRAIAPRMLVWVDALDGNRVIRSMPVSFTVHAYGQAWVAGRDVHIDQPLRTANLEQREVDLALVTGAAATAELADVRLRRRLLAGEVLTTAHLGDDGVRSGSQVTARSHLGAIDIEASARALQDGRAGQSVWVRVAGATAAVKARVIDKAIVEVERE